MEINLLSWIVFLKRPDTIQLSLRPNEYIVRIQECFEHFVISVYVSQDVIRPTPQIPFSHTAYLFLYR